MSDTSKGVVENAKAAYRRMSRQLRAGNLPEAVKLFHALPKEADNAEEVALNRPIAAVHLVFGCLKAGNLAGARKLFEAMAELGNTQEVEMLRVEVAHNLMIDYIHAGNLPEARELLEAMAGFGDAPETASLRDEAAHNLIIGYLYAGDFAEAQKLFGSMAVPDARRRPKERWGEYSRSFFTVLQKNRLFKTRSP
jgi:tetratricopeptide (TPR) repeat protein